MTKREYHVNTSLDDDHMLLFLLQLNYCHHYEIINAKFHKFKSSLYKEQEYIRREYNKNCNVKKFTKHKRTQKTKNKLQKSPKNT